MKTGEIPCPIRAFVWYNFPVRHEFHYETESIDDIGRKLMPRSRVCDIESDNSFAECGDFLISFPCRSMHAPDKGS